MATWLGDYRGRDTVETAFERVFASLQRSGIRPDLTDLTFGDISDDDPNPAALSRQRLALAVNGMLVRAREAQRYRGNANAYRRALAAFRRAIDEPTATGIMCDGAGVFVPTWPARER